MMTVKLTQFPIVGATALTCHNTQGRTLTEGAVITTFTGATRQWAYVALSRVRSLDSLFLVEEMTKEQVERFNRPMADFDAHEIWLQRLEQQTFDRLGQLDSDPMIVDE